MTVEPEKHIIHRVYYNRKEEKEYNRKSKICPKCGNTKCRGAKHFNDINTYYCKICGCTYEVDSYSLILARENMPAPPCATGEGK